MPRSAPDKHSWLEDAQGILGGVVLMALAVAIYESSGLITGQTAGLALLVSHITGWGFGPVFVLVNLPFFALALWHMGREFTIKTAIAILALSALSLFLPQLIEIAWISPIAGAIAAGVVASMGLVALFRHRASLGGIGILALYLQERANFPAGYTQLVFDACLFGIGLFFLDPILLAVSVLSAVVTNLMIAINHRTDRYIAR